MFNIVMANNVQSPEKECPRRGTASPLYPRCGQDWPPPTLTHWSIRLDVGATPMLMATDNE